VSVVLIFVGIMKLRWNWACETSWARRTSAKVLRTLRTEVDCDKLIVAGFRISSYCERVAVNFVGLVIN
jgi:hypothetical protein